MSVMFQQSGCVKSVNISVWHLRYLLSDDTAVHQETHNVQVGEELVPFSKGNYTYRTSKGIKILVEWTADRENGFRAFESFI